MQRRRITARLFALAVALTCVSTACTRSGRTPAPTTTVAPSSAAPSAAGTSASASASPTAAPVAFSSCSKQLQPALTATAKNFQFSCGRLAVPLDYAHPDGPRINLFVLKIHKRSQPATGRIGSLLVNPGGPGGSGVILAAGLVSQLSSDIFNHFDLIGFDPRGVGLSSPVQCVSDQQKTALYALNADVRTAAGRATARALYGGVVRACTSRYGSALAHINTEETARDIDLLRSSVGDAHLNYLGFSYGTRLGSVYAHEFGKNVRAMVLDGAESPSTDELATDEQQARGFEQAFDQFAADCRARPACAPLGDPRAAVRALVARADRTALPSSRKGEQRRANGAIVALAAAAAMYDQRLWPALGSALLAARQGDAARLFALADSYTEREPETGHYPNLLDANTAISCNDSRLTVTESLIAAKAADWMRRYPIFGANAAVSLYTCLGWPASGHPLPVASAPAAPPILVVGTVHDPATPYAGTAQLAHTLQTGVVLTWDGQGHTAYLRSACITGKVNSYLLTARVPAGDSCPSR